MAWRVWRRREWKDWWRRLVARAATTCLILIVVVCGELACWPAIAFASWPVTYDSEAAITKLSPNVVRITLRHADWQRFMTRKVLGRGRPYLGLTWRMVVVPGGRAASAGDGRVALICRRRAYFFEGGYVLAQGTSRSEADGLSITVRPGGIIVVKGTVRRGWNGIMLPIVPPSVRRNAVSQELVVSTLSGVRIVEIGLARGPPLVRRSWVTLHSPDSTYVASLSSSAHGPVSLWLLANDNGRVKVSVATSSTADLYGPNGVGYWGACVAKAAFHRDKLYVTRAEVGYRLGSQDLDKVTYGNGTDVVALGVLSGAQQRPAATVAERTSRRP